MANNRDSECSPYLKALINAFNAYREEMGISEKKALAKFMGELGYQESGPKRKMNLKLSLTTGLYTKIKTEENILKETYSKEEHSIKKAQSIAQYIIIEVLLSFDCRNEMGKRMHEKNICTFLGYCPRTIENYRKVYRQFLIQDKESSEYADFNKLRAKLEIQTYK